MAMLLFCPHRQVCPPPLSSVEAFTRQPFSFPRLSTVVSWHQNSSSLFRMIILGKAYPNKQNFKPLCQQKLRVTASTNGFVKLEDVYKEGDDNGEGPSVPHGFNTASWLSRCPIAKKE